MSKIPNAKYNSRGGQWNPLPPVPGLTPILTPPSEAALVEDYEDACRARSDTRQGIWPVWLFEKMGIDPDEGPIIKPFLDERMAQGMSKPEAAATLIGMDSPGLLKTAVLNYANSQKWEVACKHRLEEPGSIHDDIVSRVFYAEEFLVQGLGYLAYIIFAEKAAMEARTGGTRPEKIAEAKSGMDYPVTTAYPARGCPPMADIPQGHEGFWQFITERGTMFWNGEGVDALLRNTGHHGGAYRIMAFVHGPISATNNIGIDAARGAFKEFEPLIDNYRKTGSYGS